MRFNLKSSFKPAGSQPNAIRRLVQGLEKNFKHQTLLGVTGSGKTFSIANVINARQKPALVIAHNKTLAAQLCNEFRELFPNNTVHYFVSYYDYYQPEAYLPTTDTYVGKEAMINEEIDRLRHAATSALLSRRDVIIVASVSCIYGLGAPEAYRQTALRLTFGDIITRADILRQLTRMQFTRTNSDLKRGTFRSRGETLEVMPPNEEVIYRIDIGGQKINEILAIHPTTRKTKEELREVWIFPARHFVALREDLDRSLGAIREELRDRLACFKKQGKLLEAERLERRTKCDLEMIKQVGVCHGIENYSRHLAGRGAGEPPETLLDYFDYTESNRDYLMVIDESHMTIPQLRGMYEGDASRKRILIEHGFRLPSAADNRPLKFYEFEQRMPQVIYTSATPGHYETAKSQQVVEQIIRPTGLADPEVLVLPITPKPEAETGISRRCAPDELGTRRQSASTCGQIDDLILRIRSRVKRKERVLVTTLTKKMAEDLSEYLKDQKIKTCYIHSEVNTLDRIRILTDFRKGEFDVLAGVNLLREGLDLPEVTLVAILDADKEGFLRSETSLIQTIGRAARNVKGQVVLYADNITGSIEKAVRETNRRRKLQIAHNKKYGITPKTIQKKIKDILGDIALQNRSEKVLELDMTAERSRDVNEIIKDKEQQMKKAAQELQFELAAVLRDEIKGLRKKSIL